MRKHRRANPVSKGRVIGRVNMHPAEPAEYSSARPRIDYEHADGTVDSRCWCDRHTVQVTLEDVAAGRTRSCGARNCKEPKP